MKKGEEYGYNKIESFAEVMGFEIEELGHNRVGENFLILQKRDKDEIISFVLTGGSDNQYVYECVYSDSDF